MHATRRVAPRAIYLQAAGRWSRLAAVEAGGGRGWRWSRRAVAEAGAVVEAVELKGRRLAATA